uniref:Uncharacterized protein n=1 Tax=Hyaloperonospora arabidopsidis (strain Emoy2) TaxID=559515 RepID=M4BM12_HYAAE
MGVGVGAKFETLLSTHEEEINDTSHFLFGVSLRHPLRFDSVRSLKNLVAWVRLNFLDIQSVAVRRTEVRPFQPTCMGTRKRDCTIQIDCSKAFLFSAGTEAASCAHNLHKSIKKSLRVAKALHRELNE